MKSQTLEIIGKSYWVALKSCDIWIFYQVNITAQNHMLILST